MTGPGTSRPGDDPLERAAVVAALGHRDPPPPDAARALSSTASGDDDPLVRAVALGALVRLAARGHGVPNARRAWIQALRDSHRDVRRRACEEAPWIVRSSSDARLLLALIDDTDADVVERTAWALGELGELAVEAGALPALAEAGTTHADALVREAAVAALGAIGHPEGLQAILSGCTDRAQVRRRAVAALAPFEGAEVDKALRAALSDRDWQVRQAAEDLLDAAPPGDVTDDPTGP